MTLSANSAPNAYPEIPGYRITEQIYLGSRTVVYRGLSNSQNDRVVIKILRSEHPSFGEIVQFRNQYTITENLPIPGIIHPLSLEPLLNGYALVMEDWGGVALNKYLQQASLTLSEILAIAIQLADILHDLGQHQVVHKDIKPANILIQPESKQVKLIDFSIASLLPKETQKIHSANILEGTLAYIAPEQTGRMNRGVDYRADFYALGVTLYQLLTGSLPFQSDDPLELVHCHIAKAAMPVDEVNPEIPAMVGAIVSKLMAKNAEDRYQSGLGLQHDLQQCLNQWETRGQIAEFQLAERDSSDRFLIPEKLYGRNQEVQTLLQAFDRVASGSSELMLVAGFSGIGKTAVVNEIHKPIVRQRGYFIKGKFDQFNRNIPLSAFVQALRDLMGQLVSEPDTKLQQWRTQILQAVGENGQVLMEVIPELEQIIGKQSPASELSGSAAQNRFNLLFQKFMEVFATINHPLVIFLDDLQWADSASLQLLKLLMNDHSYLLILGAYRDNEVSPAHPFMMTVAELPKAGNSIVNRITLHPLRFEDTNHLIADTLNCGVKLAQPLTKLIDRKTKGNPFFTTQFLKALHEDGYINFNSKHRHWECDITQVHTLALSDDVVEFMALQLQKLPKETQQVLKLAACIGNQFDLDTLAIVSEQSLHNTATALWKALQEGFILPTSQIYKFFQETEAEANSSTNLSPNPSYRFLHDRIQQAAYSLIPLDRKQTTHYHIGQLLLQQTTASTREDHIFELVNQLNHGTSLITEASQRQELLQLNLLASQKAKTATAYQAARDYAIVGLSLLAEEPWQSDYSTTLVLHELAAEVAFLCGDFAAMEQFIETVITQANSLLEKINIYRMRIQANAIQNQLGKAISIGLQVLETLGICLPTSPTLEEIQQNLGEIQQLIGDRDIEELAHLPRMTEPQQIATVQVANSLLAPASISGSPLFPLLTALPIKLSIQYGNTPASAFAYVCYSIIACNMQQDINTGVKFARLALKVVANLEAKTVKPEVVMVAGLFALHRQGPIRETLPILQDGYTTALEIGNLEFAGRNAYTFCFNALACNQPLTSLEPKLRAYYDELVKVNQVAAANYCQIVWQLSLNLLKATENPIVLSGKNLQESVIIAKLSEAVDFFGLSLLHLYKLMLCYWFSEFSLAQDQALDLKKYLVAVLGTVIEPAFYFYDSLATLAELSQDSEQRSIALLQVETNQAKLQQHWAAHAPMNHQHKVDLVAAEQCRVLEDYALAIGLYDRAIAGAKENGFIQEEALANELAAKFYLAWGKEKVAAGYMQEAYYRYSHWGATTKIQDLEQRYPHLLSPILEKAQSLSSIDTLTAIASPKFSIHSSPQSIPPSTTSTVNTTLDFAAILRASQSLSSTIQIDDLLHQLSQIILQNSGADRCVLILPNSEGEWKVRSNATPTETRLCHDPFPDHPDIPSKLIYYVKNTQEAVIINACQTDLPVMDDQYFSQLHPKSILCLPILNQGNLIGILYLKNRLTRGVFTSDRLLILNFLCTQAAISLENARLYSQAQKSQRQLTQLLNNLTGIVYACANDENWTMKFISGGCLTLTGYTIADFIDNHQVSFAQLMDPDDIKRAGQLVEEAIKNHQPYQLTYRIRTKQGEEKWVWDQGQVVFDPDGAILGLEGFITDISDRKRAEIALQEKEAEYRSIFESVNDGLSIWDLETGQVVAVNPVLSQMYGHTPAEFIQLPPEELLHPDYLYLFHDFLKVLNSGQEFYTQALARRKDSTFFDIEAKATPFMYRGKPHGLTITRDISQQQAAQRDRKAAETKLLDSELFLRTTYEGVSQGICVVDVTTSGDFRFVGWNPLIESLTGISSPDIVGKNPEELLGDSYGAIIRQNYERCLAAGTKMSYEELLPFQGRDIWWLTTLNPIKDEMGNIYRIIITTIEISDWKAAEAKLQEKMNLLALRAAIDATLTQGKTLTDSLQQCTQAIVDHLGVAFARIWKLNSATQILELKASAGIYTHLDGPHCMIPLGQFKIGLIAQECRPHLTNDVLNDPRISNKEWAEREGMVAFAGYPLMVEKQVIGVLAMFSRTSIPTSVMDTLNFIADEIALDIERRDSVQSLALSEANLKQQAQALSDSIQELQEAQLKIVQGEKMASLGNLIAGVAHEINNPVGFLKGSINNAQEYIQDLLDYVALYQQHHPNPAAPVQDKAEDIDLEFLSTDLPGLLKSMNGATDRITAISNSLRTFSRADTEYKVSANLHDGIDSTLMILKYRLKANDQRPEIRVIQDYGDLPSIYCFPGQLNQVFMNILANAIDMFDEMAQTKSFDQLKVAPLQITICTTIDANQVHIHISDNGKGMTEEVKAQIFDHLFTTKGVGKGTGLGLAIANQIVAEKHGGHLEVHSTLGQGTKFCIRLPIGG